MKSGIKISRAKSCPLLCLTGFYYFQVHLGNKIYVKDSVWKDSIKPGTMKVSLAIKNLTGAIFGKKCGSLSLSGGKSPKTGDQNKEAAAAGALEVIYGKIYCNGLK